MTKTETDLQRDRREAEEEIRHLIAERAAQAGPTRADERERIRNRVLAAIGGNREHVVNAGAQLVAGAHADLADERERIRTHAPHALVQIAEMRAHNAEREERRRRLAAEQPPERIDPPGGVQGDPSSHNWEKLAGRAHQAQAELVVGGERLIYVKDPDDVPLTPNERRIARYGAGPVQHDTRGIRGMR